jgi:hypothetical protein
MESDHFLFSVSESHSSLPRTNYEENHKNEFKLFNPQIFDYKTIVIFDQVCVFTAKITGSLSTLYEAATKMSSRDPVRPTNEAPLTPAPGHCQYKTGWLTLA